MAELDEPFGTALDEFGASRQFNRVCGTAQRQLHGQAHLLRRIGAGLGALAETTLHAAVRGAELTNRLLAFARKQALHPSSTDVGELLHGMRELLRRTLGEQFEIHCYAMVKSPDKVTQRLKGKVDHFRNVHNLTDQQLVKEAQDSELDQSGEDPAAVAAAIKELS